MEKFADRVAYEFVLHPASPTRRVVQLAVRDAQGDMWKFTHHAHAASVQITEIVDGDDGKSFMSVPRRGAMDEFSTDARDMNGWPFVSVAQLRVRARRWVTARDREYRENNG